MQHLIILTYSSESHPHLASIVNPTTYNHYTIWAHNFSQSSNLMQKLSFDILIHYVTNFARLKVSI